MSRTPGAKDLKPRKRPVVSAAEQQRRTERITAVARLVQASTAAWKKEQGV